MGFNIGKVVSVASKIATAADIASSLNGIDISGLNSSNIGTIKNTIGSALNGQANSITNQLESVMSSGDLESVVGQFDIEGKSTALTSQIQSQVSSGSFDQSQIDADVNKVMEEMNSNISSMDFSSINFM